MIMRNGVCDAFSLFEIDIMIQLYVKQMPYLEFSKLICASVALEATAIVGNKTTWATAQSRQNNRDFSGCLQDRQ